jgi:hypothetical protein
MLTVPYAECHKKAHYAECLCNECRGALLEINTLAYLYITEETSYTTLAPGVVFTTLFFLWN